MQQKLKDNRKGMAMQHPLVLFIIGFFAVGFLGAIYVIVLAALYGSIEATGGNATHPEFTAQEVVTQNVINATTGLFENFTTQFGTIGTVGGVLVLLVLLAAAGIGAAVAYRKYG